MTPSPSTVLTKVVGLVTSPKRYGWISVPKAENVNHPARRPVARAGALLLIAHAAAGCYSASRPAYSTAWAPIQRERADCSLLAGVYSDRDDDAAGRSLWASLFGRSRAADRVEITARQDGLWATLWKGDTVVDEEPLSSTGRRQTRKADVSCKDGKLIAGESGAGAATVGVGVAWEGLELAKATDGALILRTFRGTSMLMLWVFPFPIVGRGHN